MTPPKLSLVVPCFNESATLEACVARILAIASPTLPIEIVIVDDASRDDSLMRARSLASRHPEVRVVAHERNQGKGAALRTGFAYVNGTFVGVQDADLEYDPRDLVRLLEPLEDGRADAVLGSRFLSGQVHRVLYYWHSAGNRFLTFVSNIFTDLNLTDIETCYKVFRREIIQAIEIEEDRFGFEPEIVAKLAARRLRIYEAGINYDGRTYADGKKIRARDGWRALYCILRYNAWHAPWPLRFLVQLAIGAIAAGLDVALFALFVACTLSNGPSALIAYLAATSTSFALCRAVAFPVDASHDGRGQATRQALVAVVFGALDAGLTIQLIGWGWSPIAAKLLALLPFPALSFLIRDRFVFRPARRPLAGGTP